MRKSAWGAVLLGAVSLLVSAGVEASSTGRCGGTGGDRKSTLTCPAGQYVIGIVARGEVYVDSFGIRCAPFNGSGKRGSTGAWQTGGGTGGTYASDETCTGNRAAVSVGVKSGIYVDRIKFMACHTRQAGGGFVEGNADVESHDLAVGWIGGGNCVLVCPSNEALYKVTIKSGSWIDSITGECRP